jgi:hypothetical protein
MKQSKQLKQARRVAPEVARERAEKAQQYFEQEAEEGSEDEDHAFRVRPGQEESSGEEDEEDGDLQELIDNNPYLLEEDEEKAYQLYLQKEVDLDEFYLKKAMQGQFRSSRLQRHGLLDRALEEQLAENDHLREKLDLYQRKLKELSQRDPSEHSDSGSLDHVQQQRELLQSAVKQIKRSMSLAELVPQSQDHFPARILHSLARPAPALPAAPEPPAGKAPRKELIQKLLSSTHRRANPQNSLLLLKSRGAS